jgi:hypothetical protein
MLPILCDDLFEEFRHAFTRDMNPRADGAPREQVRSLDISNVSRCVTVYPTPSRRRAKPDGSS